MKNINTSLLKYLPITDTVIELFFGKYISYHNDIKDFNERYLDTGISSIYVKEKDSFIEFILSINNIQRLTLQIKDDGTMSMLESTNNKKDTGLIEVKNAFQIVRFIDQFIFDYKVNKKQIK